MRGEGRDEGCGPRTNHALCGRGGNSQGRAAQGGGSVLRREGAGKLELLFNRELYSGLIMSDQHLEFRV